MKTLENTILTFLAHLDWMRRNRIKNAVINELNPSNLEIFDVQFSRALKSLEKQGYVERTDKGHKEGVFYKITKKAISAKWSELSVFAKSFELSGMPYTFGAFRLNGKLPSYEEWKKSYFEDYERFRHLKEEYEQFKEEWKEAKAKREKKI
jgi:DNA-binding PadR family transcriptional regulator